MPETCMCNENLVKMAENVIESPKFGHLYRKSGSVSSNLMSDFSLKVQIECNRN